MRLREQSRAQSGRPVNALQYGAGRTLAVGAGDVDEPEPVLRIARPRSELERVIQPELRAEKAKVVEKLDGLGVCHRSKVKVMSWVNVMVSQRRGRGIFVVPNPKPHKLRQERHRQPEYFAPDGA